MQRQIQLFVWDFELVGLESRVAACLPPDRPTAVIPPLGRDLAGPSGGVRYRRKRG